MYQFDLKVFNSTRRFFVHNQQIPDNIFGTDDEGLCPLNDKFLEAMSVTIEQSEAKSRYWWTEGIEDPELAKELKQLSPEDIEIITLFAYEHYTQDEIANLLGVNQSTICRRLCGRSYNKEYLGYVCINEIGDLIKPHYVTEQFPKLLEANGFRHIRFHDLRHSCANLMLANGVPMKQIQEWLGHSDMSTTANIYSHLDAVTKADTGAAMSKALG